MMDVSFSITSLKRLVFFREHILPLLEQQQKEEDEAWSAALDQPNQALKELLTQPSVLEGNQARAPVVLSGAPLAALDAVLANTVDKLPDPPTTFPNPAGVAGIAQLGHPSDPPTPLAVVGLPAPDPTPGVVPALATPSLPAIAPTPAASVTSASTPAISPIDYSKLGHAPNTLFPTSAGAANPSLASPLPTSPSDVPLPLGLPPLPAAADFEVYHHTGEKKAGYAHAKAALQVLLGVMAQITTLPDLANLEEANRATRDRFDRGEKSTLTRAFTRRREELAEIDAIMSGAGAPATTERPALSLDEFRIRAQALTAKGAGVQALNAAIDQLCDPAMIPKKLIGIPADKYWTTLDALQQVIDNKGN